MIPLTAEDRRNHAVSRISYAARRRGGTRVLDKIWDALPDTITSNMREHVFFWLYGLWFTKTGNHNFNAFVNYISGLINGTVTIPTWVVRRWTTEHKQKIDHIKYILSR